jgi:DNA-binding FadR family transcriptional regulator
VDEDMPASGSPPPYRRIADALRGEILDGVYPVGGRIPSQADLEQRFRVSRPTIQRALTELRKGGFIDNRRGRSAEVLPWPERGGAAAPVAAEAPEPAFAALATHITQAFEQRHITLDAFSLTTQTLNSALGTQLQRILRGELNPASIHLRLLLPSQAAHLAVPRTVADPGDERPLRRLRQLVRGHVVALRSGFTSMSDRRPDIDQVVEFRTVPVTPLHKLYLVNRDVALFGHYQVVERPIQFGDGQFEDTYDVLGIDAMLFPYRRDPDNQHTADSRFVAEAQAWFDSLWSTIAEPLTLFE